MQEQKIDLTKAQPHQAIARRALKLARGEMGRPDFRGDEERVAPNAGRAEAFPDFALVIVHFRRNRRADTRGVKPARRSVRRRGRVNPTSQGQGAESWRPWPRRPACFPCAHRSLTRPSAMRAHRLLPPNTAKAASGASSMTLSSALAGPRGERLPCSQFRTVSTGTPIWAAKAICVRPVWPRTLRA